MEQAWLFDGVERNYLLFGVPELGLDAFINATLRSYAPVLIDYFNKESTIWRFFQEMQGPQQATLLNVDRPRSHKIWFRTKSGHWQYTIHQGGLESVTRTES